MSTHLVRLQKKTIEKLTKKGKFGQSFNDVIEQLLKKQENNNE